MSTPTLDPQESTATASSQVLTSKFTKVAVHFGHADFGPSRVSMWMRKDLRTKTRDLTLIPVKVREAREECFAYHTVVSSAGQDARDSYYGSSRLNGVESPFEIDHALQSYFGSAATQQRDDDHDHLEFAEALLTDSLLKDKYGFPLVADAECLRLLQIKNEMTTRTADPSYVEWIWKKRFPQPSESEASNDQEATEPIGTLPPGVIEEISTPPAFASFVGFEVVMEEDEQNSGMGTSTAHGSGLGGGDGVHPANCDPTILRQLRSLHLGHSDAQATHNKDEEDSTVTLPRLYADGPDPDDQEFDDEGDEDDLGLARYSSHSG